MSLGKRFVNYVRKLEINHINRKLHSSLGVGDVIPNIELKNIKDDLINLYDYTENKKGILVFYRGSW